MLNVSRLHKCYVDGDNVIDVLRDVSFTIAAGSNTALMGPSGSGKSTLLNILAGILAADSGSIVVDVGHELLQLDSLAASERTKYRRRHVGYVHQFFNLIPTLTVLENLQLPGELNRDPVATSHAAGLLEEFGLGDRAHAFPNTLSGGEQQRVAVARALLTDPPLILADEPTGNLDAANARVVSELLFSAARRHGTTLIVATHSDEVAQGADQILRLSADGLQAS